MEYADEFKNSRQQQSLKFIAKHWKLELGLALVIAILLWGPTINDNLTTRNIRYDLTKTKIQNVPQQDVAIVFGAGVFPNGQPTPYLQERVNTAVKLYQAKRVKKILMTGDNSSKHYNEPVAMGKLAEQQGVPAKDIVLDYAGFNTYDSCYRAWYIFKVSSAILVSQGYHLPRAISTCNMMGLNVIGVDALHTGQDFTIPYIVREWISTDKSYVQNIFEPNPTVRGSPEPIHY